MKTLFVIVITFLAVTLSVDLINSLELLTTACDVLTMIKQIMLIICIWVLSDPIPGASDAVEVVNAL